MSLPIVFAAVFVAAISRCNDDVATQLEDRTRAYSTSAPAADGYDQRVGDLAEIIQSADAELDIVSHVCPNENDLAPIGRHLAGVEAWALLQQADATRARLQPTCPAGAPTIAAGFL